MYINMPARASWMSPDDNNVMKLRLDTFVTVVITWSAQSTNLQENRPIIQIDLFPIEKGVWIPHLPRVSGRLSLRNWVRGINQSPTTYTVQPVYLGNWDLMNNTVDTGEQWVFNKTAHTSCHEHSTEQQTLD